MDRQPITQEGYDKILAEIRHIEDVVLPECVEALAEARDEGDLKENAEYHGQRERQGMLNAKVAQMKSRLAGCFIVDKSTMPKGVVVFGAVVTVKDLAYGDEETYEFVGPGEEDYDSEPMKILTNSPIAQALLNKKVGDTAEAQTPNGTIKFEIMKIQQDA